MYTQRRLRSACASAQSDQSLRRHSVGSQGSKASSGGQRRLWSDCADMQADLSSLGAHAILYKWCARAPIYTGYHFFATVGGNERDRPLSFGTCRFDIILSHQVYFGHFWTMMRWYCVYIRLILMTRTVCLQTEGRTFEHVKLLSINWTTMSLSIINFWAAS